MSSTYNRIHILGASGSGTSTLGKALSEKTNYPFLDTDDFYWKKKYTEKNIIENRIALFQHKIEHQDQWILAGSLCGWGDVLIPYFDLVVFVHLPRQIRMLRLADREKKRYGKEILPGGTHHEEYTELIEWAGRYDSAGPEIRSKFVHEEWLKSVKCPVLRFDGDFSVEQKLTRFDEFQREQ